MRPYRLDATTLPLRLLPAVWFALAGFAWPPFSKPDRTLSSSSAFLQSMPQPNLAGRPQPASTSHGLSLPTAHTGSEGPLHAGMPARFGPPSGFGYPLDGLRPSWSSPVLFRTGSALGIRPSELSPRERLPGHYHPKGPTCRFSCRFSHHTRQRAGPTGRGFWVLTARESLTAEQRFNLPTAGCSLGILAPTRS